MNIPFYRTEFQIGKPSEVFFYEVLKAPKRMQCFIFYYPFLGGEYKLICVHLNGEIIGEGGDIGSLFQ